MEEKRHEIDGRYYSIKEFYEGKYKIVNEEYNRLLEAVQITNKRKYIKGYIGLYKEAINL